jgi:aldehyde dehydrogenase (NAD+)
MDKYLLYINGEFREAQSKEYFDSVNPADDSVNAQISKATVEDVKEAISAAREAFDDGRWTNLGGAERGRMIKQIVDKINEHKDRLIELEVKDSGSTIRKATEDIMLGARTLNYYSKMASTVFEENIEGLSKEGISKNLLVREPIGVVASIIPWNFPFKMAIWKLGPALAAGCTIVLKPSSETSLSVAELAKLIDETDIPKGVINIVTGGSDIGTEMVSNKLVDKVAFTGSTEVGRTIMKNAAPTLKKLTLECGGKSPNIILDDTDMNMAVDGAIYAGFYHQGQCCEGGTRLLVQESVYDEFTSKLKEKIEKMKIGDPMDKGNDNGPVVSKKQFESVMNYIEIGKSEGAKILTGGNKVGDKGYYIQPTIFTDVDNKMRIAQEEIFGPVVVIIKFKDDDEAVKISNDSEFGLAAGIWSGNDERALALARRLRAGTVWINEYHLLADRAPFGGYKQSGVGREFGVDGLKEYTEAKHIHIDEIKDRSKKFWYNTVVPKG